MILEQRPSTTIDPPAYTAGAPADADEHLSRLLAAEPEPFLTGFIRNIKETINPPKLPPLELTSKPVPVKDIWGKDEHKGTAGVSSLLIHGVVIGAVLALGATDTGQNMVKEVTHLVLPDDLKPYVPDQAPKKQAMGGGGGGGDRSPTPPMKGKLPKIAPRQFTPPQQVINNPNPKLTIEPTIVLAPDTKVPQVNLPNIGDPLAGLGQMPSNGSGSGGGIGSGKGGGIGKGDGVGLGPGRGAGTGGGDFRAGGGVKNPELLSKVEPEYSDEARKAKFQGMVVLRVVVDESGKARNIRVVRPLGMGLDEKAIEAVGKWTFKPALRGGVPFEKEILVEVNFRLL